MTQGALRVNANGRAVRCLVGLVGAALAIAVAGGCSTDEPDTEPTDAPTGDSTNEGSATDPRDESSDGAALEVAESAVTVTETSTGPMASYAIIVSNPSVDIALYTKLEIQLLDGDGEPVVDLDVGQDLVHRDAHLIMPGQTQAISALAYIETDDVESVDVALGGTKWADPQDDRFKPLTAADVSAQADGDGAVVTFTVDSHYSDEISPVATYAIFRDSSGELLGGTNVIDAEPQSYVPGANDGEIAVSVGVPPGWDPDSTEVYVDPFVE